MLSIGIAGLVGCRAQAAAALHQLQRVLPELQQLLAGHGVALGAPPALSRERPAAPGAARHAVTGGRSSQLPEGSGRKRCGFCMPQLRAARRSTAMRGLDRRIRIR